MTRSIAASTVLLLVFAACSGDGGSTTEDASTTTAAETATSPSITRVDPADAECTALWPEVDIQAATGEELVLLSSTIDGTGCTYSLDNASVAVFFRDGGQSDFDAVKDSVAATGEIVELDLCDGAYSVSIEDSLGTVEALDSQSNRIYNVTVSGLDDPPAIAADLMAGIC